MARLGGSFILRPCPHLPHLACSAPCKRVSTETGIFGLNVPEMPGPRAPVIEGVGKELSPDKFLNLSPRTPRRAARSGIRLRDAWATCVCLRRFSLVIVLRRTGFARLALRRPAKLRAIARYGPIVNSRLVRNCYCCSLIRELLDIGRLALKTSK